jgi:hypothetical protein
MLEYVDKIHKDMFMSELAAFARINGSSRNVDSGIRPYLEKMLESDQVRYYDIWLDYIPDCAIELCQLLDPPFLDEPRAFRVLVKDRMPMHAEPITMSTLKEIGWKPRSTYWWRYQRGTTKFTEHVIYRVRTNGTIRKIWRPSEDGLQSVS